MWHGTAVTSDPLTIDLGDPELWQDPYPVFRAARARHRTARTAAGEPVDASAVDEWTRSEAGLRFMTDSSDSWRAADIASGSAADDATGKAARTLAAYTGGDPDA